MVEADSTVSHGTCRYGGADSTMGTSNVPLTPLFPDLHVCGHWDPTRAYANGWIWA